MFVSDHENAKKLGTFGILFHTKQNVYFSLNPKLFTKCGSLKWSMINLVNEICKRLVPIIPNALSKHYPLAKRGERHSSIEGRGREPSIDGRNRIHLRADGREASTVRIGRESWIEERKPVTLLPRPLSIIVVKSRLESISFHISGLWIISKQIQIQAKVLIMESWRQTIETSFHRVICSKALYINKEIRKGFSPFSSESRAYRNKISSLYSL